jgi:phasin family protein
MFPMTEELSTATKSHFHSQMAMITAFSNKAFESIEKIVELNMSAVKASLETSAATAKQLMAVKDAQEFFAIASAQTQPNAEKLMAYTRHLASITTNAQAEIKKVAETQFAETNRQVMSLVDEVTKNAPAGSEQIVSIMKSAMGNANAGYQQLSKTTKQAAEVMEGNITNAVTQFAQAAEKSAARIKK